MFLQFRLVYLMCSFIIDLLLFFVENALIFYLSNVLNVLGLFSYYCHSCSSGLSLSVKALPLPLCFQFSLMCNTFLFCFLVFMLFPLSCEHSLFSGVFLFDTVFFCKCKLLLLMLLFFESFLLVSQSFSHGMCFSFYTQALSFSMLCFHSFSLSFSMLSFHAYSLCFSMSLSFVSQPFFLGMIFLSFLLSCFFGLLTKAFLFSFVTYFLFLGFLFQSDSLSFLFSLMPQSLLFFFVFNTISLSLSSLFFESFFLLG